MPAGAGRLGIFGGGRLGIPGAERFGGGPGAGRRPGAGDVDLLENKSW